MFNASFKRYGKIRTTETPLHAPISPPRVSLMICCDTCALAWCDLFESDQNSVVASFVEALG